MELTNPIIIDSDKVEGSRFVLHSRNVFDSSDIYGSSFIHTSEQVYDSEYVDHGKQIAFSKNVDHSTNIVLSKFIIDSRNIFDCFDISESSEIYRSTGVTKSRFCSDSVGINNCLFCHSARGLEYCVFNKPIDERRYEFILRQYQNFELFLNYLAEWPKDLVIYTPPREHQNFDIHYTTIPNEFWEWIKNLPNYDPAILYNITMDPKFLELIK